MNDEPLRIAVLVSGRGSNLRAIWSAIAAGACHARIVAVLADREGTAASEFAAAQGVPVTVVPARAYGDRSAWDGALADAIRHYTPDVVVLAGFMRLLGAHVLGAFAGRIINVHPSLLPVFPGMDGPAQAVAAGVKLAGCTVHVVDAGVDSGPILAQAAVPVLPDDDAARLHARIQVAEHELLPAVIHAIARGSLTLLPAPRWGTLAPTSAALSWPRSEA